MDADANHGRDSQLAPTTTRISARARRLSSNSLADDGVDRRLTYRTFEIPMYMNEIRPMATHAEAVLGLIDANRR